MSVELLNELKKLSEQNYEAYDFFTLYPLTIYPRADYPEIEEQRLEKAKIQHETYQAYKKKWDEFVSSLEKMEQPERGELARQAMRIRVKPIRVYYAKRIA